MKILFITHHYLSDYGGGTFASRAFINAFAEVADEMTLVYPVKEGQDVFSDINHKIKRIPVGYDIPLWRKTVHLLSGKVHRFFGVIDKILLNGKYDIAVFDTSIVSFRLIDRVKSTGAKIIVIHHNYQYEYFRDNTKFPLSLPILFWCRKYERQAVKRADLNLTLTEQDIKLLSRHYNNGFSDNFKRLGVFEFCSQKQKCFEKGIKQISRFIITGNLADMQTEKSLISWLKEYYPILIEEYPGASLLIAGKNPGHTIQQLCQERRITLIQSPVSMDEVIKNVDCYICPTSLGGGLKLRVMDGLRWGLPVITHSVSARGYDSFIDKGYMFSYNDVDGFRNSLIALKSTHFSRRDIYNAYREEFSFETGVGRVKSVLDFTTIRERRKLLVFHPYLAPYRLDLYNGFMNDFEVKVLLSGSQSELDTLAFNLDHVNSQAQFDYSYSSSAFYLGRHPVTTLFWKRINEFRPDIVLSHEYGLNTIAAILSKSFYRYRHYVTCDDSLQMATGYSPLRKILRNYVIRHVDGIICVNPDVVRYLRDKYPCLHCKFLYFPIIQNDTLLEEKIKGASPIATQYVEKYGLQGKRVLLYVGRLAPEKNIDLAIDSYRLVSDADSRFIIVGGGPLEALLKERVHKYNLSDSVIFTGPLSGNALLAWYYRSDLFILASSHEPFGAVVNEALAGGCRCIVSDHCGSSGLITKENGQVFESGNVDQLSSMMKRELSVIPKLKVHKSLMPHTFVSYYNDLISNF